MEKKIDRIIQIIRENMAVGANGFTSNSDPKGPVAGFDPVMTEPIKRGKKYAKGGSGSRKRWLDYLRSSNGRRH